MINLQHCPLFHQIEFACIEQMIQKGLAYQKSYQKDDYLYHYGDVISSIGIVMTGSIQIIKQDYLGNNTILASSKENELFAESFAMSHQPLEVNIKAGASSMILWIPIKEILPASNPAPFQSVMLQNLMLILSNKNLYLTKRIDVLSQRSTKEKVMTFLYQQAQLQGFDHIVLPYNRQELADYLCVERSALSSLLSQLKKEGLINFHKNKFQLYSAAS